METAIRALQNKIVFFGRATTTAGNNVIDMKYGALANLSKLAILAPTSISLENSFTKRAGNS